MVRRSTLLLVVVAVLGLGLGNGLGGHSAPLHVRAAPTGKWKSQTTNGINASNAQFQLTTILSKIDAKCSVQVIPIDQTLTKGVQNYMVISADCQP